MTAARVLDSWQRTLQAGVPAERTAAFHDDELLLPRRSLDELDGELAAAG